MGGGWGREAWEEGILVCIKEGESDTQLGPKAVDREGRMVPISSLILSLKDMVFTLERVDHRVYEKGIATF